MFPMAVALGCDLFDSAAYMLYAKEDRYMMENGTSRLNELDYFPCTCPKCTAADPKRILELEPSERMVFLAEHNLYVCAAELKRIEQAIKEGRLWELVEMRAHCHPSLLQALKKLKNYSKMLEEQDPISKNSGHFYFDSNSLMRPEISRHRRRMEERYSPRRMDTLLLVPETRSKPFHKSVTFKQLLTRLRKENKTKLETVQICFYTAPFGVVPLELDEVYPLSQHETVVPPDNETANYVAEEVARYVLRTNYQRIVLLYDPDNWNAPILKSCADACTKKNIKLENINVRETDGKKISLILHRILSLE